MSNAIGLAVRTLYYFFAMAAYVLVAVWAYYIGWCLGFLARTI